MPIAILPEYLANQIAAGEVVERPASVVKELVENALDAGATAVTVRLEEAGLRRIEVQDNGHGIPEAELPLALARHATSKISTTEGLFNIHTFGFRGEALPSIASVARLTLSSRANGSDMAWQITPEGELRPAALPQGTRLEVEDLFYATPARRKFLKSARAEAMATRDVMEKIALAHPATSFSLWEDGREVLHVAPEQQNLWGSDAARFSPRVANLLGGDFAAESLTIAAARENQSLTGVISAPQRHIGVAQQVYVFVNGRPIKDRSLIAAVRQAYGDALPKGRHPQGILMLSINPEDVDVNVHPAKSEVRFRNSGDMFGFLFAAVRQALASTESAANLRIGSVAHTAFAPLPIAPAYTPAPAPVDFTPSLNLQASPTLLRKGTESETIQSTYNQIQQPVPQSLEEHPLGAAIGQVAESFIVATTPAGDLVLVDQHAAHERLVYEALKKQLVEGDIASQPLLLPIPVPLTARSASALTEHAETLANWGLQLSPHSPTSVMVESIPALLGDINPTLLLKDLAAELETLGTRQTLQDRLERILSTFACHHSVRANRRLSLAEQNQLLRDIESNPAAQTCNHGRPTVRLLKASELAGLFER